MLIPGVASEGPARRPERAGPGAKKGKSVDAEKVISEETRKRFRALLDKTNKEHPTPRDVKALSDLLSGNRKLELWRETASAGYLAEVLVIENAHSTPALKECWKHRLQVLKKDLGYDDAPMLEQLLIQQAALCWLKLNLVELSYSNTMKQSITLTLADLIRHTRTCSGPSPSYVQLGLSFRESTRVIIALLTTPLEELSMWSSRMDHCQIER